MKKLWNKFTDIFGKTIFHPQFVMNSYGESGLKAVAKYGKGKLLDIGCGRSPYKKRLLNSVDSYTGLDHPKSSRLYHAEQKPDYYADAQSLPFKKSSFDTVILFQVLEYLAKPEKAIKEATRVLNKNGILILTTPFLYPRHDGNLDLIRLTKSGVDKLFKEAGLEVIRIDSQGNFFDFIVQSFLVFYFKKTMCLANFPWRKILVPFLIIFGLIITPLLNILTLLTKKLDKNSDFPINILAIGKR